MEEILRMLLNSLMPGQALASPVYLSNQGYHSYHAQVLPNAGIMELVKKVMFPQAAPSIPKYMSAYDFNYIREQTALRKQTMASYNYFNPIAISGATRMMEGLGIKDARGWLVNATGEATTTGKIVSDLFNRFMGDAMGPYSQYGELQNTVRDTLKGTLLSPGSYRRVGAGLSDPEAKEFLGGLLKATYTDELYTKQRGVLDYKDMVEIFRMGKDYQIFRGGSKQDILKRTTEFASVIEESMKLFGTENKEEALTKLMELTSGDIPLTDTYKLKDAMSKIKDLARTANVSVDLLKEVVSRGAEVAKQFGLSGEVGMGISLAVAEKTRYINATGRGVSAETIARSGGEQNVQAFQSALVMNVLTNKNLPVSTSMGILGVFAQEKQPIPQDVLNSFLYGNTQISPSALLGKEDVQPLIKRIADARHGGNIEAARAELVGRFNVEENISRGIQYLMEENPNTPLEIVNDYLLSSLKSGAPNNELLKDLLSGKSLSKELQKDLVNSTLPIMDQNMKTLAKSVGVSERYFLEQAISERSTREEVRKRTREELPKRSAEYFIEKSKEQFRDTTTPLSRFMESFLKDMSVGDTFRSMLPVTEEESYLRNVQIQRTKKIMEDVPTRYLLDIEPVDPSDGVTNVASLKDIAKEKGLHLYIEEDFARALGYLQKYNPKGYLELQKIKRYREKLQPEVESLAIKKLESFVPLEAMPHIFSVTEVDTSEKANISAHATLKSISKDLGLKLQDPMDYKKALSLLHNYNRQEYEKFTSAINDLNTYAEIKMAEKESLESYRDDELKDLLKKNNVYSYNSLFTVAAYSTLPGAKSQAYEKSVFENIENPELFASNVQYLREKKDRTSVEENELSILNKSRIRPVLWDNPEYEMLRYLEEKDEEKSLTKRGIVAATQNIYGRTIEYKDIVSLYNYMKDPKIAETPLGVKGKTLAELSKELPGADMVTLMSYYAKVNSEEAKIFKKKYAPFLREKESLSITSVGSEELYTKAIEYRKKLDKIAEESEKSRKETFFNKIIQEGIYKQGVGYLPGEISQLSQEEIKAIEKNKERLSTIAKVYGVEYAAKMASAYGVDLSTIGKVKGLGEYLGVEEFSLDKYKASSHKAEDITLAKEKIKNFSEQKLIDLYEGKGNIKDVPASRFAAQERLRELQISKDPTYQKIDKIASDMGSKIDDVLSKFGEMMSLSTTEGHKIRW